MSEARTTDMLIALTPEKSDGPVECVTVKHRATTPSMPIAISLEPAELRDPRVDVRIEAGEIPPRPTDGTFASWYDEHLQCETPGHKYFLRERGERRCAICLGRNVAA